VRRSCERDNESRVSVRVELPDELSDHDVPKNRLISTVGCITCFGFATASYKFRFTDASIA
jgi:hypothetical protein